MKKNIFVFLFLTILIFLFTRGLSHTYFQQDEWNGFGIVINLSHGPLMNWFTILGGLHFIPLSQFFWFLLYKVFGFQAKYYAYTEVALHLIASFLVYILAKKMSGKVSIGLLTAVLFATNSRADYAFIHFAIFPATTTCLISILCFFLYLFYFLQKKTVFSLKDLLAVAGIFIISSTLREDSLILIPLFPVWLYLYNKKAWNKKNRLFFTLLAGIVGIFFIFRAVLQLTTKTDLTVHQANYLGILAGNAITFPFKIIFQNFIEGYTVFSLILNHFSYLAIHGTQIPVSFMSYTILATLLGVCILGIFLIYAHKYVKKDTRKNIYFAICWIMVSGLLLSTIGRPMVIIESRYLYLSSFPVMLIFSYILFALFLSNNKLNRFGLLKLTIIILVGFYIVSSYTAVQNTITLWQFQGSIREKILTNILQLHPSIPKKVVFYVQCKTVCTTTGTLGIANQYVLPFSFGPGWAILLQYAKTKESTYAPFFSMYQGKEFLWDLGSEGYRQIGSYGYGYYYVYGDLKKAVDEGKFSKDIIVGLNYDDKTFTISDISSTIQKDL